MTEEPPTTITITMDNKTSRFYQGAAAANEVVEEQNEFPDHETRLAYFWFNVGALATGKYGCETAEDFENFIRGVCTRVPSEPGPKCVHDGRELEWDYVDYSDDAGWVHVDTGEALCNEEDSSGTQAQAPWGMTRTAEG